MHIAERLHQLHAPPVPMHIAEPAHIHQDVEPESMPRIERAQQLIMPPTMRRAQLQNLVAPRLRQRRHRSPQLPVRVMTMRIQQRRRNLDLKILVIIQQVHHRRRIHRSLPHQLTRRLRQLLAARHRILTRLRILHQRRRSLHRRHQLIQNLLRRRRIDASLAGHLLQPVAQHIPRRIARRLAQLRPQLANLRKLRRQQPRHLRLQRARIHNLPQRSIRRQRQQIPRRIERPRLQRPRIALRLHLRRAAESPPSAPRTSPRQSRRTRETAPQSPPCTACARSCSAPACTTRCAENPGTASTAPAHPTASRPPARSPPAATASPPQTEYAPGPQSTGAHTENKKY